jgi:large subunit ribosomal protein L1
MQKLTKKRKVALSNSMLQKLILLAEAAKIVKEITSTKFDSSVDIA